MRVNVPNNYVQQCSLTYTKCNSQKKKAVRHVMCYSQYNMRVGVEKKSKARVSQDEIEIYLCDQCPQHLGSFYIFEARKKKISSVMIMRSDCC